MWLGAGGFLFHLIQSALLFWRNPQIFKWSISLDALINSCSAPTKFGPLSKSICLTLPLLVISLLRAWMKESVVILHGTSMYFLCPACKTSKYHTITYYFTLFDFYLEWSKHANCTRCKGCASLNLSLSKSAITWIPIFPLSLWQVTRLNMTDFVKEFALII